MVANAIKEKSHIRTKISIRQSDYTHYGYSRNAVLIQNTCLWVEDIGDYFINKSKWKRAHLENWWEYFPSEPIVYH